MEMRKGSSSGNMEAPPSSIRTGRAENQTMPPTGAKTAPSYLKSWAGNGMMSSVVIRMVPFFVKSQRKAASPDKARFCKTWIEEC